MKILMVSASLERSGGAEEYLADVVLGLQSLRHEVRVIFGRKPAAGSLVIDEIVPFSTLVENLTLREFLAEFEKFNPTVVNFQNLLDPALVRFVSQIRPTTVFLHDHEAYCPGSSKYFFRSQRICDLPVSGFCGINAYAEGCLTRHPLKMWRRIRKCRGSLETLRTLKRVVCNSDCVKKNLVQNGVRPEAIVVNHLFPRNYQTESITSDRDRGVPLVLFVGRLFKEKGVDHLLKALRSVRTAYRAVIVGEGWERQNLMRLAQELEMDQRVVFRGFCSREEVARLYQEARLVVVPSLWPEPFGLIGLEAFSFGKPVVAYASGGMGEWLVDGRVGYLVERGSVEKLSEKISLLLTEVDLAERFGESARRYVADNFNRQTHLENLIAVYRELSGGKIDDDA